MYHKNLSYKRAIGAVNNSPVRNFRMLRSRLFACLIPFTLALPTIASTQVVAPLADPAVSLYAPGVIKTVLGLSDGSVIIGGIFQFVNGEPRNNIAQIAPDGSLSAWNPGADGQVVALAADPNGNVFVAGQFVTIAGASRNGFAKFTRSTLALDRKWDPAALYVGNGPGNGVTVSADASGYVFVAGSFLQIGGQSHHLVAKLSATGTGVADPNWDPSPDQSVLALVSDTHGNVYAGGNFGYIGGANVANLARLSASGTGAADASWTPLPNYEVDALALDGQGDLFVGGQFTTVAGQSRARLAKFLGTGALDTNWNPGADDNVNTLAAVSGWIYAGGQFQSIGGQTQRFAARMSADGAGAVDPSWITALDGTVYSLSTVGTDGIAVGGAFADDGANPTLGYVSTTSSGSIATQADAEVHGTVYALAAQPSGSVIAGGDFARAGAEVHRGLLRLKADGILDSDWQATVDGCVYSLAIAPNGDVYAGGEFSVAGGQSRPSLAKFAGSGNGAVDMQWVPQVTRGFVTGLTQDSEGHVYAGGTYLPMYKLDGLTGTADPSWTGIYANSIYSLAHDSHNNVVAGGDFVVNSSTQTVADLVRLSGSGSGTSSVDWSWAHMADSPVFAAFVDRNDVVYLGGSFTSIDNIQRDYVARLSSYNGDSFDGWYPEADGPVYSFAEDSSGMLYVGGYFANIGMATRNNLARISTQGTGRADAWNPGADSTVLALAIGSGGRLYAGGAFQTIGAMPRIGIAAFQIDHIFANGFEGSQ